MWMRLTTTSVTSSRKQQKDYPTRVSKQLYSVLDVDCESLYKMFLQSPQGDNSSLAATTLLVKLDKEWRD